MMRIEARARILPCLLRCAMAIRLTTAISAVVLIGLSSPALPGGGVMIDSREYKLLLIPENFAGDPSTRAAEFWNGRLKPIIATHLDRRENGESRAKKSFEFHHQRRVSFRDTAGCILSTAGFSYRERTNWTAETGPAATVETTLKFRSPDIFLSTASRFEGPDDAKSKFEEDISISSQGSGTRSGYSYSVSQKQPVASLATSLQGALDAYPGSFQWLESLSATPPQPDASLAAGPAFAELVYSKAFVDLGHNTDAEFDLTLWYPSDAASRDQPAVVEISFGYDTDDGEVDRRVTLRASKLFAAMQGELAAWIAPGSQSKTARALPNNCHEK
jgi:hypothetical protein